MCRVEVKEEMTKIRIWKTTKRISITRYHHSEDLEGEGIITDVGDEWYGWLKKEQMKSPVNPYQNMLNHQYQSRVV